MFAYIFQLSVGYAAASLSKFFIFSDGFRLENPNSIFQCYHSDFFQLVFWLRVTFEYCSVLIQLYDFEVYRMFQFAEKKRLIILEKFSNKQFYSKLIFLRQLIRNNKNRKERWRRLFLSHLSFFFNKIVWRKQVSPWSPSSRE